MTVAAVPLRASGFEELKSIPNFSWFTRCTQGIANGLENKIFFLNDESFKELHEIFSEKITKGFEALDVEKTPLEYLSAYQKLQEYCNEKKDFSHEAGNASVAIGYFIARFLSNKKEEVSPPMQISNAGLIRRKIKAAPGHI